MWLGVLGPVQCALDRGPVEVSGRLNRTLLAALAVDRDRVTGVDELVDALWGDAPPAAAEKVIRNRVSLLRSVLTPAFIDTAGSGYRLGREVTVDVKQFEDPAVAGAARLTLWRGSPLLEVAEWAPARAAIVRLNELHAHLEELAIADQLDAGMDASALVGTAEALVQAEPFRERRWALLMRGLYLAGPPARRPARVPSRPQPAPRGAGSHAGSRAPRRRESDPQPRAVSRRPRRLGSEPAPSHRTPRA